MKRLIQLRPVLVVIFVACLVFAFTKYWVLPVDIRTYKVSIPGAWGELNPSLQHNRYGDAILTNVFEPLVRLHSSGVIYPRGARSWNVSDDNRIFTFEVDGTHRFSDGSALTAADYKRSWEDGLKASPVSSNSSGADGLFDLVGFEEFRRTGTISGIVVKSGNVLELHYKKPFRMAFNYLSGIRFAAFKNSDQGLIGSGPFEIQNASEKAVELTPNSYFKWTRQLKKFWIEVVPSSDVYEALRDGYIDIAIFGELSNELRRCKVNSTIDCVSGPEAGHTNMMLNANRDRLFSSSNNRLALQALVHAGLQNAELPAGYTNFATRDPQTFFPLQKGRIPDAEAKELVERGLPFVSALVESTKKKPIYIVTVQGEEWVIDFLKSLNLTIDKRSQGMAPKERLAMYYKTYEADIVFGSFGVHYGDPDGLYHLLGTNGSISSPMLAKSQTAKLIDEGRHILGGRQIDEHYQNVGRSILNEVPYVHLFFGKNLLSFRSDRVRFTSFALETNEIDLHELIDD